MNKKEYIKAQEKLTEEMREYDEGYRKKICSKCVGTKQQKERLCEDYGGGETYCEWLAGARVKKFGKKIYKIDKRYFTPLLK